MPGMIRTSRVQRAALGGPVSQSDTTTYPGDGGVATASFNGGLDDDSAFAVGGDIVLPAGFLADDTAPDTVEEGDIGAARMTLSRVLRASPGNDTGVPVTYAAGAVAATTPRMTLASNDPAVTALEILDDWDESDRCKVNPIAGQAGVQGGSGVVTALTQRVVLATDVTPETQGDAAHDAAVSGNPFLGGIEARTSDGTPVGNGDAARAMGDTLGKQVLLQGSTHDLHVDGRAVFTTDAAADIIGTAGAGRRIVVTAVLVTNAHATVGTKVEIRDGTTVKIQGFAAAAGGRFSHSAGGTPLFISTANTAVTARCVTTGSDVDVNISGYTIGN